MTATAPDGARALTIERWAELAGIPPAGIALAASVAAELVEMPSQERRRKRDPTPKAGPRRTRGTYIEHDGVCLTVAGWSRRIGVSYDVLLRRVRIAQRRRRPLAECLVETGTCGKLRR